MRRLPSSTRNSEARRGSLTLSRGVAKSRSVERAPPQPTTHTSRATFSRPIGCMMRLVSPAPKQTLRTDSCDAGEANKIAMSLKIYLAELEKVRANFEELKHAMTQWEIGLSKWEAYIMELMVKQPARCMALPVPETFEKPVRNDSLWMPMSEMPMTQPVDERRHIRRSSMSLAADVTDAEVKRFHLEEAHRLFRDASAGIASRKLFEDATAGVTRSAEDREERSRARERALDVLGGTRRMSASHRLPAESRKESAEVSARPKVFEQNARSTSRSETPAEDFVKPRGTTRHLGPETTTQDESPPPDSARSEGLTSNLSNAEDIHFPSNPIGLARKPLNVPTLGLDSTKLMPAAWLCGQATQGDVYK